MGAGSAPGDRIARARAQRARCVSHAGPTANRWISGALPYSRPVTDQTPFAPDLAGGSCRPTRRAAICGSSTSAGCSGNRDAAATPTTPDTSRAPSSSISTRRWPRARDPVAIHSPPRPTSGRRWRPSASARTTRSWPTTMPAARSRRDCGGCSTTSGTRACRVLDGGYPAWLAAGPADHDRRCPSWSARRRPGSLRLHDAWTKTIDRDALAAEARSRRPPRCPGGTALSRRSRADRRRRGPHPDRDQRPIERFARDLTVGCSRQATSLRGSDRSGPTGRPVPSSPRAAAVSRPVISASRCERRVYSDPLLVPRFVQRLDAVRHAGRGRTRARASRQGDRGDDVAAGLSDAGASLSRHERAIRIRRQAPTSSSAS